MLLPTGSFNGFLPFSLLSLFGVVVREKSQWNKVEFEMCVCVCVCVGLPVELRAGAPVDGSQSNLISGNLMLVPLDKPAETATRSSQLTKPM